METVGTTNRRAGLRPCAETETGGSDDERAEPRACIGLDAAIGGSRSCEIGWVTRYA